MFDTLTPTFYRREKEFFSKLLARIGVRTTSAVSDMCCSRVVAVWRNGAVCAQPTCHQEWEQVLAFIRSTEHGSRCAGLNDPSRFHDVKTLYSYNAGYTGTFLLGVQLPPVCSPRKS